MAELSGTLVLRDLLAIDAGADRYDWKPFRDGIEICSLYGGESNQPAAALLRYAPGAQVPRHVHDGFEHILVLAGEQSDQNGTYPAGTLLVSPPGSTHSVVSAAGCIVLAIWHRPVRFT